MNLLIKIILVMVPVILDRIWCQEILTGQDLLRLHKLTMNSAHNGRDFDNVETAFLDAVNARFGLEETDLDRRYDDVSKLGRSDSKRKIFHIKNPFNGQVADEGRSDNDNSVPVENEVSASNQYAAMQYAMPPEGFLNQFRSENQEGVEQLSTPTDNLSFLTTSQATQPYSPSSGTAFESSPMNSQNFGNIFDSSISANSKLGETFPGIPISGSSYTSDSYQATGSPVSFNMVSTPAPNAQYVATPTPSYASSPTSYVSSPIAQLMTSPNSVSNEFNNRFKMMSSSDSGNNIHIDHYNHGNNGIRNPFNVQSSNEMPSSTISPSSTAMPENLKKAWRDAMTASYNNLAKSVQNFNQQYNQMSSQDRIQKYPASEHNDLYKYNNNIASSNNMFLNFAHPSYDSASHVRTHTRDLDDELGQSDVYSHGNYGWKLNNKHPLMGQELFNSGSYSQIKPQALQSNTFMENPFFKTSPISNNYDIDMRKPSATSFYNGFSYKSNSGNTDTQDFLKAATKAHDDMKNQFSQKPLNYFGNGGGAGNYAPHFYSAQGSSNVPSVFSTFFGNSNKQKDVKQSIDSSTTNPYSHGYNQDEVVTAMPNLYNFFREADVKFKQPFDHAKALKSIVPIDVSNVVFTESAIKTAAGAPYKLSQSSFQKDQMEQALKQLFDQNKPLSDQFFKDKNGGYAINIKTKPDSLLSLDSFKNDPVLFSFASNKQSAPESVITPEFFDAKRFGDIKFTQSNYLPQASNSYEHVSPSSQQMSHRQQDTNGMFKLSDLPYKFTPNALSTITDNSKLHNLNNMDQNAFTQSFNGKINQNIASHQFEIPKDALSKYNGVSKPYGLNHPQLGNGIKIANPYNVDLRLLEKFLNRNPAMEESRSMSMKEAFDKISPLQLDNTPMQQMLSKSEPNNDFLDDIKSNTGENYDVLAPIKAKFREADPESLQAFSEMLNSPKNTYPSNLKYSRSQEDAILPAAESSNNYPIGAVVDQEGIVDGDGDLDLDSPTKEEGQNKPKKEKNESINTFELNEDSVKNPVRSLNSLKPVKSFRSRIFPHDEPYPLLKPPPRPIKGRYQSRFKTDTRARRRRIIKHSHRPTSPLFASEDEEKNKEKNRNSLTTITNIDEH